MAYLTGFTQAFSGDTSVVDSAQKHPLGTWSVDTDGNIYIYLKGVGSTAAGSWVSFDEAHVTTLLIANAVGRVAIAMAAVTAATSFGWYQIYGKNTVAKSDTTAADKGLWIDGTTGRVDDVDVAGDDVIGAVSRSADTSNVLTVELNFPFVDNEDRIN